MKGTDVVTDDGDGDDVAPVAEADDGDVVTNDGSAVADDGGAGVGAVADDAVVPAAEDDDDNSKEEWTKTSKGTGVISGVSVGFFYWTVACIFKDQLLGFACRLVLVKNVLLFCIKKQGYHALRQQVKRLKRWTIDCLD